MSGKWKAAMYLMIETKSRGLIKIVTWRKGIPCALSDNSLASIYSSQDLSWSRLGLIVKENSEVQKHVKIAATISS